MATRIPSVHSGSPCASRATLRDWVGLTFLLIPVLLVSIDNTVLSFALPAISIALTPTANTLLWITDVYPLVLAGLLVAMGSLGDRVGRRRILLTGVAGFGLLSAAASFAPSAGWLVAARAGLGVFGAMLMPATLSLLRTIFTDARQRTLAVAIWAATFSVGMSIGPVVGGLVLQTFGWRAAFFLAVPLLVPMVAARWLLPESRNPHPGPVDPASVALSMLTLVPAVYAIKGFAHDGPTSVVGGSLLLGLTAGVTFVRRQLHSATPLLDMRLFKIRAFTAAVLANLLSFFSVVGFTFFEAQQLQLVLGLSPVVAGALMIPGAVGAIVAGLWAVRLLRRLSRRQALVGGLLFAALAYAVLIVAPSPISIGGLVLGSVILSVGLGVVETVANDVIVASVPADRAGAAAGVSETAYELGTLLGFAVLGTIITSIYRDTMMLPPGLSGEQAEQARETLGGAVRVAQSVPSGDAAPLLQAASAAFDHGVGVAAILAMLVMVLAAALVNRMMSPRR